MELVTWEVADATSQQSFFSHPSSDPCQHQDHLDFLFLVLVVFWSALVSGQLVVNLVVVVLVGCLCLLVVLILILLNP